MSVETKLNHIVKLLSSGDFPNKQALQEGYEELKSLFASYISPELLPDAVIALKSNLFYQHFKLDTDPQFLKTLIDKLDNTIILEKLSDLEVNYSQSEKKALSQQSLLLAIDYDLKETIEFCTEADKKEFEIYFEDLNELKALLCLDKITPKNVEWFLHSDLFDLIANNSDSFDISLTNIYQELLDNSKISTKKDFFYHKNILIEKANKALKDKESFNFKEFISILDTVKIQSKKKVTYPKTTFYKVKHHEKATLSPMAKKALLNNLKKYPTPVNQTVLKR